MTPDQLTFFTPAPLTEEAQDARQRELWAICWNWSGPEVGGITSFEGCIHDDIDGRPVYVMMRPTKVLAIELPFYILEIIAPEDPALHGRKFKLRARDLWPHVSVGRIAAPR